VKLFLSLVEDLDAGVLSDDDLLWILAGTSTKDRVRVMLSKVLKGGREGREA
jgi:hypothetical protein